MESTDSVTSRRTTPDWEAGDDFGAAAECEAEVSQLTPADEDISQEEPASRSTSLSKRQSLLATGSSSSLTSGLVTAAALLAQHDRPRIPPSAFKHGMAVEHPQYGPGTIIALSGNGPKRTATVRFFAGGEERKFRLLFSDLTPADI